MGRGRSAGAPAAILGVGREAGRVNPLGAALETRDRGDRGPLGQGAVGTVGQGATGMWDKGTWRHGDSSLPPAGAPGATLRCVVAPHRGDMGQPWDILGSPRCHRAATGCAPPIPAAPRTPAWPPLALQAAVGCACVAVNPPNYSEPGGLGGEIKSRMGEKVHFLLCHAGLMG